MLSIGALSSAAQGASYYERDGYYGKDDPEHRAASAWAGKGADELGLKGPVDPVTFRAVLEGRVPDGSGTRLGRRGKDGEILHRPGRDLTFSAPKSVSLAALVGGDDRIVEAHDRAVAATLAWVEKNAGETRMKDPASGKIERVGGQKIVAATFRHDTSRNLDPQLHTHAVLANMVQGEDGKWRSMANEGLYARQKLIGTLYRSELAASLLRLGYGIEKTHTDGRFEIAGVPREAVEAFSSRRAEIEAAMAERNLGDSADNPRLAERAALMTRAAKRDIDREELHGVWRKQAADLGFDARALVAAAAGKAAAPERDMAAESPGGPGSEAPSTVPGSRHIDGPPPHSGGSAKAAGASRASPSGRSMVGCENGRTGIDSCASCAVAARRGSRRLGDGASLRARGGVLARRAVRRRACARAGCRSRWTEAERAVATLERGGALHAVNMSGRRGLARDRPHRGRGARDDRADAARSQGQGRAVMRGWEVQELPEQGARSRPGRRRP